MKPLKVVLLGAGNRGIRYATHMAEMPDKYQVVENGRYQQNGAGEKRITEGMAGIEELTDGFRHGVMGGVMG